MFEKNRMTSKIIFIALVVFFVTTVCHAQFFIGDSADFSTTSTTKVGDQRDQTTSGPRSGTTVTSTTTNTTTASTDNSIESENSTDSDTNIDSASDLDQDITSSTDAADLTTAEQ